MLAVVVALSVASSSGLLINPDDIQPVAGRLERNLDESLANGGFTAEDARAALGAVVAAGNAASAAQAWQALRQVAKHEREVQHKVDALVPAILFVEVGGGQARAFTSSFEQAMLDLGAIPLTSDPARRRGKLEVTLATKMADANVPAGQRAWLLEARATFSPFDNKGGNAYAKSETLLVGKDPKHAASVGMAKAAGDLAKGLVLDLARGVAALPPPERVEPSRHTLELVAELKREAKGGDARAKMLLDAFPASLIVEVKAPQNGDSRTWSAPLEQAFLAVSKGALPLALEPRGNEVRVSVVVREERASSRTAALKGWALRTTATLVDASGHELGKVVDLSTVRAASAADAAAGADAVKAARRAYDALVQDANAKRDIVKVASRTGTNAKPSARR